MFSNSTLCSAQNVSSVTECCSSSGGGIPCVGSSCPSSGWSFVPHDPDCGGDPEADCRGTCTEIELVKVAGIGFSIVIFLREFSENPLFFTTFQL